MAYSKKPPYKGKESKPPYKGKENKPQSQRGKYEQRRESAGPRETYGKREGYGKPKREAVPPPEPTPPPETRADELPFLIIGRNAVREAVRAGRSIDRILVQTDPDGSLREIVSLARDSKLVIREVDRRKLDELTLPFGHGGKPANHQGIVAYAAGVSYCDVADILAVAKERGQAPFVVVLDGIEDPHNLGSIIRSADCAGVHGVVIGKRRSAQVTAAAVKASAGATEHVKVARVVNVSAAIIELKRAGLWIAGADMAGRPMYEQGLNGPLALVIGGEGAGLSKLVKDNCDFLVSIPMEGHIGSLNAGVAAAVLLFEKRRQDNS
ncbi:MAG: 23S rRNA (guanosine(2251)-2'-O)-methyltransferase RlmB [Clostridiales bacterium]|nr:23S rRNA (guanosine(2251)-2'-O)-methyltransferase RlmB [Clostridiales bacterium]